MTFQANFTAKKGLAAEPALWAHLPDARAHK